MDPVTNDNGKVLEGVEDWSFIVLMANGLDLLRTRLQSSNMSEMSLLGVLVTVFLQVLCRLSWQKDQAAQLGYDKGLDRCKLFHSKRSKDACKGLVLECTCRDYLETETVLSILQTSRAFICDE